MSGEFDHQPGDVPEAGGALIGDLPIPPHLNPTNGLKAVQTALKEAGIYTAPIDGLFGRRSWEALHELLKRAGQPRI